MAEHAEISDILVIGAGLAGATAAAELAARDFPVTILEARDRVGGRGYSRAFNNDPMVEPLDFGGSWITPWQHRIRALCRRHAIALRPRHPITATRYFRDGALHEDGPVSCTDRPAHDKAIARLAADAALARMGHDEDEKGRPLRTLSLAAYLERIGAPASTRDWISAWWALSGNGDKRWTSAAELLHSCAHDDMTPDGIANPWADSLVGGVNGLCARMIEASGARLVTCAPVAGIEHGPAGVAALTAEGRRFAAKAAVIATGFNPLGQVRFSPPLSPARVRALKGGHIGRAVKVWAKVRNVPVGTLATGGGHGIEWMLAERATADGATMLVGFGVAGEDFKASQVEEEAQKAVARFFPEAELLALDMHDWNSDPYSRGAWLAPPLGAEEGLKAESWVPVGRLAFASSDIASCDPGWLEGAAVSGEEAAAAIARLLGRSSSEAAALDHG
jgi:monoamine oxidase